LPPQDHRSPRNAGFFFWNAELLLFTVLQPFAAVIMRIRDPKTTALIFASGKMVVTGAKS
jgi:hypothetical protein